MSDHTLSDHVFTLTTETTETPLIVTTDALADFLEHGLEAMNEILEHMAARLGGFTGRDAEELRKRLVADMMLEGFANDNTRKVVLCALWLTHHFPGVTGLVSQGGAVRFVADEDAHAGPNTPCAVQA